MRAVLDTSVLIANTPPAADVEAAISVVSLSELQFGLLVARDAEQRGIRATRLGMIAARFPAPLPVDDRVAREWGRLQAMVVLRGGQPRRRAADLLIAATANVHNTALLTKNPKDLKIIEDLVDVQEV